MRLSATLALGFATIAAGSPIYKNIERSVQKNGLGERGVSEKNPDLSTGSHSPQGKPVPEEGHPSGHPSGHPPAPSGPSWPNFGNKTEPACSLSGSFSFQPLPSEFPTASFPHDSLPSEFPPVSFPTGSLPPPPSASVPFPTEVPSEIPFPGTSFAEGFDSAFSIATGLV